MISYITGCLMFLKLIAKEQNICKIISLKYNLQKDYELNLNVALIFVSKTYCSLERKTTQNEKYQFLGEKFSPLTCVDFL